MGKDIQKLQSYFEELFGETYLFNCLIEVENDDYSTVLSANKEGMLYLIRRLLELCEQDEPSNHYHLDNAGMASKCDKPMIISLIDDKSF